MSVHSFTLTLETFNLDQSREDGLAQAVIYRDITRPRQIQGGIASFQMLGFLPKNTLALESRYNCEVAFKVIFFHIHFIHCAGVLHYSLPQKTKPSLAERQIYWKLTSMSSFKITYVLSLILSTLTHKYHHHHRHRHTLHFCDRWGWGSECKSHTESPPKQSINDSHQ